MEGQFCFYASFCNGGECVKIDNGSYGFCKCDNITTTTSTSTSNSTSTSPSTLTTTPDPLSCEEGQYCSDDSDCNGGKCSSEVPSPVVGIGICKCDNITTTTSTSISTSTTIPDSSTCEEGRYCIDDSVCNGGECSHEVPSPVVGIGICKCDNIATTTSTPTSITTTNSSSCEELQRCIDDSYCNGGECVIQHGYYGFCKCDNIGTTTSTPPETTTLTSTSTTTKDSSSCVEDQYCSNDSDCNGGKCGENPRDYGFCRCDSITTTTSISTLTPPTTSTSTTTTDECKEGQFCYYDSDCNGGECSGWSCKCDNITTSISTSVSTSISTSTHPAATTPSSTPKVDYGMRFCLIKVKPRKTKRSSNINIKSNYNIDIFPCDPDETCEKDFGTCYKPGLDAG